MYKLWIAQTRIIHDAFVIAAIRCLLRLARRQLTTARINCHDLRPTGSTELPSLSCWGASIQPPRHSIYRLHSLHSLQVIRRTNYYYLQPWLFVTTTNCHKFNDWPIYRRPERILRSRGSQIHRSYVAHEYIYCPIPILTCSLSLFPYLHIQYDEGLHGYMDSGSAAAAMYDPHAGHRPPGLQGLPPHHSPHMSHAAAAAAAGAVGMHGYHSGHGSAPSHVSPVANHVMGSIPEVHKRDKDAIYGYVPTTTRRWW